MLRYLTAGESHAKQLIAILDGIPAGIKIDATQINIELARRQLGFGRGERMSIEKDEVIILSGVRNGHTLGSPIALSIANKDSSIDRLAGITRPRPGHADLAGALKYDHHDIRNVLERASARNTATTVAIGTVAKILLKNFSISTHSLVTKIGTVEAKIDRSSYKKMISLAEKSPLRCPDKASEKKMIKEITSAKSKNDTIGGIFEVIALGVPAGLGTFCHWDKRLDARIAFGVMAIPAIKGIEFGLGFGYSDKYGTKVHDEIFFSKQKGFYRKTNNSGGFEGGISTGEPIILRAIMKPISTTRNPLHSVDIKTKKEVLATFERSDICAVPAAGVVAEAVVALEVASAFLEKFGGDSLKESERNYKNYLQQIAKF